MQKRILPLTYILAASAMMIGMSTIPTQANTTTVGTTSLSPNTTTTTTELTRPSNRGRYPLMASVSAIARDVGPSSTVLGTSSDDPRGGPNSGLPLVPGAPSAGSTGLGGH
jgi:hypothetical protein